MSRLALSLTLFVSLLLFAARGHAAPPPPLSVEVLPALGAGTAMGEGWTSFVVWLKNPRSTEVSGFVELVAKPSWARQESRLRTRASFALAPGTHVAIGLPTHGFAATPADFELKVVDQNDLPLSGPVIVPDVAQGDPSVVDLSVPSRILPALRGVGLPIRRGTGGYRAPTAIVSSPPVDPATGDLLLPRWAAGYAGTTLVLTSGKRLASLGRHELQALTEWVLAGGALAVAVERAEDLRLDALIRLAGGPIANAPPSRGMYGETAFFLAPDPSSSPSLGGRGMGHPVEVERRAPRGDTASLLEAFGGGNLRASPWGAVASYGLGELHLLAFDLGEPFASDRWVTLKLADLLRHSWERQAAIVHPLGRGAFDGPGSDAVRRLLDPNRTVHLSIALAALFLLAYAVVAGPVSFWLAARRGRPLRALVHLPFWAAGAFVAVVVLGLAGKGVRGRARQFTLIEAGSGMEKGTLTRFRGFYSPSSRDISVKPSSPRHLLDVAQGDEYVERTVLVHRDGVRLERLRTKPWSTVVVREDGAAALGGGISMVRDGSGQVVVKNRAARDLVGAVLKLPGRPAVGFARIKDGALVREADGETLPGGFAAAPGYTTVHALGTSLVKDTLERYAEGLSRSWDALETLGGGGTDFWPEDVPVLLAQLDGGSGTLSDSGFEIDEDRVLVRVIGFGGVP